MRAVGVASMVLVVAGGVGCGSPTAEAPVDESVASSSAGVAAEQGDVVGFCDDWDAVLMSGDEEEMASVLAEAPAEIAPQASVVMAAEESDEAPPEADEAALELLGWLELNCDLDAATETGDPRNRRVAPPLEATPEGFEICSAGSMFAIPSADEVGAVLYGDTTADDPYAAEMLGVVWGTDGGHAGDGDRTRVIVRGVEGVAAPITVFQQTVLEDLGTVIAWEEGGESIGLYGRGFDQSRLAELLDIAEGLSSRDGVFELAAEMLPSGFGEIYRGSVDSLSLILPVGAAYSVNYRSLDTGELLTLSGAEMSADEFDAVRFLTMGLRREDMEGRDAIVGNAWNEQGPAVVTWREPDGLAVRLIGTGTDLEMVREVARSAQELSRGQWEDIVNGTSTCYDTPPTE